MDALLKDLFKEQRENIDYFFEGLDPEQVQELFDRFFECEGNLYFSGVGKSGIIAKKIAMTMLSMGTKALYISPQDALHGDLGIVDKDDIFVLLSKSGETDELFNLVPYIRNKGAKIISWTCSVAISYRTRGRFR